MTDPCTSRGTHSGAFLVFCCLLALHIEPAEAALRPCQAGLVSSSAAVSRIVDGDTVVLENQQHVRLIGLDTREMNSSNKQDRLWAQRATDALETMLQNRSVTLLAGADRKDRHGRLLAHLQLADGSDAAQRLLAEGLAVAVAVGANTACADANLVIETKARADDQGLWKHKGLWWSDQQARLAKARGFYLIRSMVTKVFKRGNKINLLLDNGLTIKPGKSWPLNRHNTATLLNGLEKKTIEVRGWLSGRSTSPELTLHHPANMTIVRP